MILVLIFLLHGTVMSTKLTSHSDQNIIIEDVTTTIDISTQVVSFHHKISFISSECNVQSFMYYVSPSLINNVADVKAKTGYRLNENLRTKYHGNGIYEIVFKKVLRQNESEFFQISAVFTHVLKPFPSRVKQHEKHLVLYSGPISLYSPYVILNHTSYITIGDGSIQSVTTPPGFKLIDNLPIVFGSRNLSDQQFINSDAKIHYEHKNPFLTVKMLVRTIEISHWGSISVTEVIDLEHSGATLYGPFHRQLQGNTDGTVINFITTFLPASATDISVYDEIGNISSTQLTEHFDCVEMKFSPRFLLYGGWKVKYIVKYSVPTYEYLFNEGDEFILKMRTVDHIFNDMVIDAAVVEVILPEGAEKTNFKTPYPVDFLNESYHISYLDVFGRPVLSFKKENLVEDHIQDLILSYTYSKYKMLFEPLIVIAFLEILFILSVVFNRVHFCISEEDEKKTEKCSLSSIVQVMKVCTTSYKQKKKRN